MTTSLRSATANRITTSTDLVEKLTGQKPLQLVDYITKHKAAFTLADKTHTK